MEPAASSGPETPAHLVRHAVWDERPDHHSSRLPPHNAEAQTRSVIHQIDLLQVAPVILRETHITHTEGGVA